MPYKILQYNDRDGFITKNGSTLIPKLAKHSFAEKLGHEKGKELITAKIEQIERNPLLFNGEKALFYFKDCEDNDGNILKIVPEDYASVSAALELNRNFETITAAAGKGQFLRSHFVAGVIVVCKTIDDKVVFGSRDSNRDKTDAAKYPLQFPCGFIDVNEVFYEEIKNENINSIYLRIAEDARRELKEEVLHFDDSQILSTKPIGAIYETKKWPVKEEKGGGTKNVHIIKSFAIQVDVNMSYSELEGRRGEVMTTLQEDLDLDPENKDLLQQKKDFDEMRTMGCIPIDLIPSLLEGRVDGTEVEIDFDGRLRRFVAEHGMTLQVLSQHLSNEL